MYILFDNSLALFFNVLCPYKLYTKYANKTQHRKDTHTRLKMAYSIESTQNTIECIDYHGVVIYMVNPQMIFDMRL